MVLWWTKKKSPMIAQYKTGHVNLTSSNLKKKSTCNCIGYILLKKVTIINNVPYIHIY